MPDKMYQQLIEKIESYHPAKNYDIISKAYKLATEAHGPQIRKSGEPYIIHPIAVAQILAELELDLESIAAGLLHDVIEDTIYTFDEIKEIYGEEIALLVDGVTKLGKITYTTDKEEIQAENYRKMFLAMAKDIRVILIKLADRLHNMRTLKYMPEHKQVEKAKETLDIYAPLAHRLGISKIKSELEDLTLKYLHKDAYYELVEKIAKKRDERVSFIENIVGEIEEQLKSVGINARAEGRPKHFFSIYKKMVNKGKTLDQIYDLFAVRAIVESEKDCYGALGVIHEMYTPIPGRFKDYIAMPKPNMYQSLHTTLMGPEGEPFEVQIRTIEMHRTCEYGIAAHWKYKEGKTGNQTDESSEQKLSWLKQILEWQKDLSDNKEFMDAIKSDFNIFTDSVYAFTPTGDVIALPAGSTPIDFAYHIHSAIGNRMVGARVNEKIVTFDYKIHNGDRVEVLTSQNSKGPSRDWLNIVCSSQAKSKINQWFKKQFKEENIIRGKELFDKCTKTKNIVSSDILKNKFTDIVQRKYGFKEWDAVYAAIGHGGLKEGQVINKLYEEYSKTQKKVIKQQDVIDEVNNNVSNNQNIKSKDGIVVKGITDVAVRFSRCCNPVPGDEIIGYITRGRGVSIHRTDCVNVINLVKEERQRLIEADWQDEDDKRVYQAEIVIYGDDRQGLLIDISSIIKDEKISMRSMNAKMSKEGNAVFDIVIEISSKQQLEKVAGKIRKIPGVSEVIRNSN